MTLGLTLLWIITVSAFAVIGAWYARQYDRPDALIALYVTLIVFANIAASKTIAFDLGFAQFFAPAAVLIFSVTFLLTDVVNERFGKKETQRMIGIAVVSQIALVLFSYMVLRAEGAPFFQNQGAFETVFGAVPRIVVASLISFFISENFDAYLYHWFRKFTHEKHLWMRNVFSSLPAMFLDSVLFVTIAFYGIMPIMPLIFGLIVIKWIVGIVDIPFMYLSRAVLGKRATPKID